MESKSRILTKRRRSQRLIAKVLDQRGEEATNGSVVSTRITEANSNQSPFDKLNNDCLYKIFTELPIRDRMRVERVCQRWKYISEEGWPSIKNMILTKDRNDWAVKILIPKMRGERIQKNLSLRAVEKLLLRCGRFLNRLIIGPSVFRFGINNYSEWRHCDSNGNLTLLIFGSSILTLPELEKIFSICSKLKAFEMKIQSNDGFLFEELQHLPREQINSITLNVGGNDVLDLPYSAAKAISEYPNLHSLQFHGIKFDLEIMEIVATNQSVTELKFCYCYLLDNSIFTITKWENLVQLTLDNAKEVSENFLRSLARNCQKLQTLNMTRSYCYHNSSNSPLNRGLAEIAKLPFLEYLRIDNFHKLCVDHVMKMTKLKVFSCRGCKYVNDDTIISLLTHAKNLECVDMTGTGVTRKTLDFGNEVARRRTNNIVLSLRVSQSLADEYRNQEWSRLFEIEEDDESFSDVLYAIMIVQAPWD